VKIGLISDIHATVDPLREALAIFRQEQVDIYICAGDIAGYGEELDQTVELLIESEFEIIAGNHDNWYLESSVADEQQWTHAFFSKLPSTLNHTFDGIRLYVVHASPPCSKMKGIKLLDEQGIVKPDRKEQWINSLRNFKYEVLIVGHTHQVFSEWLGSTLVINPGSTKFNHTCAILTLPSLKIQVFPLSNKTPLLVWNWGQMERMYENRH
jgi:putative phosphoesterase